MSMLDQIFLLCLICYFGYLQLNVHYSFLMHVLCIMLEVSDLFMRLINAVLTSLDTIHTSFLE